MPYLAVDCRPKILWNNRNNLVRLDRVIFKCRQKVIQGNNGPSFNGRLGGEAVKGEARWLQIVDDTPLIAIDLILRRPDGRVLMGKRTNRPAQGFWFVPGGRVLKSERLADALVRIVRRELGEAAPVAGWQFVAPYEHFYDDNFLNVPGISTHYVVLAHRLVLVDDSFVPQPDDQHEEMRWFAVDEVLTDKTVHPYARAYFA
jgi:colanic acid biosynthesis protein WcaH